MTLTLTILLGFFLGAALILALSLQYLERQKWMRMFCGKQGIPIDIMEGNPAKRARRIGTLRLVRTVHGRFGRG